MANGGSGGYAEGLQVPLIRVDSIKGGADEADGGGGAAQTETSLDDEDIHLSHLARPRSLSVRSNSSVTSIISHVIPGVSTVTASSFTFTNFIIQPANPANLPQACQQAGLLAFPLLVILFGAVNCFTCDLLADGIAVVGVSRAVGLAELLSCRFGDAGWYAGAAAVILANFGALVFTIILIGDMITPLVGLGTGDGTLCSPWLWNLLVAGFVLVPMALIKNMSGLDDASKVAVVIIITLVLCLVGFAIYLASEPSYRDSFGDDKYVDQCTARHGDFQAPGDTYSVGPANLSFISALSNLAFSFNAQANVFPLYAELEPRSPVNMKKVNKRAMTMSGVIFVISGVFGYVAFLDATKGNCVKNFPVKGGFGYFMNVVRLLLAVSLVTSYPLTLWECRSHLEQMVASKGDSPARQNEKRFAMSMVLIVLSTAIAVAAKDVSVVFGFFGATACPFLMFILPTLYHLKAHRPGVKQTPLPVVGHVNWHDWRDRCALGVLVVSVAFVPLALYSWVEFTL